MADIMEKIQHARKGQITNTNDDNKNMLFDIDIAYTDQ
jgi:hypothetical protein